jgi:probable O-glycosylation ligase (exosortase A-associated)
VLRTLFVLALASIGVYYILQGGVFYTLVFYIGNAYFRPEEWVWGDHIRNLKFSFLSGAFVILGILLSGQRLVVNGRVAMLFLFLLHTVLSTIFTTFDSAWAWRYWTDFLKSTLITYAIVVLVTDYAKFRLVLLVMVMAVGIEGAKQGWLYLLFPPAWGANPNSIPFLGDNNGVAVGMLMLVPIVALLAQTTPRKWARPLYGVLLLGMLARAITTYSRGAFLACLGMGVAYWLRSQHKFHTLLGTGIILVIVLPMLPAAYWDRMSTIQTYEEEEASALGRLHFWRVAVDMARDRPLLGIGYMSFLPAYDTYDFSSGQYGHRRAVHSSYFTVLAELGYVGAALFAAILCGAFRSCHRVRKLSQENAMLSGLHKTAFALEMGLVAFLVGGIFLSYAYKEIVWHYIGLTIALEEIAVRHASQGRTSNLPEMTIEPSSAKALSASSD